MSDRSPFEGGNKASATSAVTALDERRGRAACLIRHDRPSCWSRKVTREGREAFPSHSALKRRGTLWQWNPRRGLKQLDAVELRCRGRNPAVEEKPPNQKPSGTTFERM